MENTKNQITAEIFNMKGDWKSQSKKLKVQYPQLTDEDLKFEEGKENDLLRRVENRLQKNREEVIGVIKRVQPLLLRL
jgi:hypothetical protein